MLSVTAVPPFLSLISELYCSMIQAKNLAMVFVAVMVGTVGGAYGFIQDAQFTDSQTATANIYGHVEMVLRDADGNIKQYEQSDNLIVDMGMDTMGDLMFPNIDLSGNTEAKFSYIGIGKGATAVDAADTNIETLITGCNRVQDTDVNSPAPTSATGEIVVTVNASFTGANCADTAVNEAVLADASTNGNILAHKLFASSVNLGSGDTLDVTWTITIT